MKTALSMTTDFAADRGDPSPHLRRIADAGFTHVHWCHQWNTDFLYDASEIQQIAAWLAEYGLQLLDLHGSAGVEKAWNSPHEYARLAGVELVRNRIDMTAALGGDVVILHTGEPAAGGGTLFWRSLRRSLDALQPSAASRGVRLAIENGPWPVIRALLAEYPPDYVGLCYDSGHGNIGQAGLDELDAVKERLLSVHLHDNDGRTDQHKPPFTGTVDWTRLAGVLAGSGYRKCLSFESTMRQAGISDEAQFLAQVLAAGERLTAMLRARGHGGLR